MSENLEKWKSVIEAFKIQSVNKAVSHKLALSINIIELPTTDTSVLTITVLKNNKKAIALEPSNFARLMKVIEINMKSELYNTPSDKPLEDEYYINISKRLNYDWYNTLKCHRLFFIPTSEIKSMVWSIFDRDDIDYIYSTGISEVILRVNTNTHKFILKYQKD